MMTNKSLLLEYVPFSANTSLLREAISNNQIVQVSGVLQRAGAKNQNGRVYPIHTLKREADKYNDEFVKQRRALGECDHPDSSVVNLANASHHVTKMWWDGDNLMGEVEILNTPAGNILKNIIASGVTLGISSRGVGSIKEVFTEDKDKYLEVQEDFELIAFDFVSNPSTHGAYMHPMNESKNVGADKTKKINDTISQIICDIQGVCNCK
jgi:hypothetical protein